MKLRLAWLADGEDADSYSASETRIVLRAIARQGKAVPMWFALGSIEPPHVWDGIRVFPVATEPGLFLEFLRTLMDQQRPDVAVCNLPRSKVPVRLRDLAHDGVIWVDRISPEDAVPQAHDRATMVIINGRQTAGNEKESQVLHVPYIQGLIEENRLGKEPTAVVEAITQAIDVAANQGLDGRKNHGSPAQNKLERCLVMRQQLFCNASLSHVMFELTNALIDLGVPTVPQTEHAALGRKFIHSEEDLLRSGAQAKWAKISSCLHRPYDPEEAIVMHFAMLGVSGKHARFGAFQSLTPHEVLYTTGNHTVAPDALRKLLNSFEMIFAPSSHVLRPYLEAGLPARMSAIIPHGVDTDVFSPAAPAVGYPTSKGFRFLQTSFPWVYEKGFDLCISAFTRAFNSSDDVALVLRTPKLRDSAERGRSFGRLEELVKQATSRPSAPEILLIEQVSSSVAGLERTQQPIVMYSLCGPKASR